MGANSYIIYNIIYTLQNVKSVAIFYIIIVLHSKLFNIFHFLTHLLMSAGQSGTNQLLVGWHSQTQTRPRHLDRTQMILIHENSQLKSLFEFNQKDL